MDIDSDPAGRYGEDVPRPRDRYCPPATERPVASGPRQLLWHSTHPLIVIAGRPFAQRRAEKIRPVLRGSTRATPRGVVAVSITYRILNIQSHDEITDSCDGHDSSLKAPQALRVVWANALAMSGRCERMEPASGRT